MSEGKFCVTCKHHKRQFIGSTHRCFKQFTPIRYNLVTGEPIDSRSSIECFYARSKEELCGAEGKWYERDHSIDSPL